MKTKNERKPIFVPPKQKEPWIISNKQDPKNLDLAIITVDREEHRKSFHHEIINFLKNNSK